MATNTNITALDNIRDVSRLRELNPKRFSQALAHMITGDFDSYTLLLNMLLEYDAAISYDKTKIGYNILPDDISVELRSSIMSFVQEVDV